MQSSVTWLSANLWLGKMTPNLCNHQWFTLEPCGLGALLHFRHDVDPGVCVFLFFPFAKSFRHERGIPVLLNQVSKGNSIKKKKKKTHVLCKILRNKRLAKWTSEFEVNENPYIDGMKSLIHPEIPNIHMDSEVNEYPYPRFETLHSPTNPTHTHGCLKPTTILPWPPSTPIAAGIWPKISRLYLSAAIRIPIPQTTRGIKPWRLCAQVRSSCCCCCLLAS